jgi:hypothetical protein
MEKVEWEAALPSMARSAKKYMGTLGTVGPV